MREILSGLPKRQTEHKEASVLKFLRQLFCSHRGKHSRAWVEDRLVRTETICLASGKRVPPDQPMPQDVMLRMLDAANK